MQPLMTGGEFNRTTYNFYKAGAIASGFIFERK